MRGVINPREKLIILMVETCRSREKAAEDQRAAREEARMFSAAAVVSLCLEIKPRSLLAASPS